MTTPVERPDIDALAALYNEYVAIVNKAHNGGELTPEEDARAVALLKEEHAAFPALLQYARELEGEVHRLLRASAAYTGGLLAIQRTVEAATERMTEVLHEGTEHWDAPDAESR